MAGCLLGGRYRHSQGGMGRAGERRAKTSRRCLHGGEATTHLFVKLVSTTAGFHGFFIPGTRRKIGTVTHRQGGTHASRPCELASSLPRGQSFVVLAPVSCRRARDSDATNGEPFRDRQTCSSDRLPETKPWKNREILCTVYAQDTVTSRRVCLAGVRHAYPEHTGRAGLGRISNATAP